MKTSSLITTFATAAVAAIGATVAEECQLIELIPKLVPLLGNPNYRVCQSESGYTFYPFTGLPTPEQEAVMCANSACQALLVAVIAADLPACDVEYDGMTYNLKETVDKYALQCLSSV